MKQIVGFLFLSVLNTLSQAAGQITVFDDFMYWHASQQSTSAWAYVQTSNTPPAAAYTEPNVSFSWSPGFKLGVQYKQPSLFDMKLYWTYFSTKTRTNAIKIIF